MPTDITLPGPKTRWHYTYTTHWLGPLLMRLLGGWQVSGREHIPDEGPALICPNHVSYADPPLVAIAIKKRRTCFMSKKEVFQVPIIGWFIRISYAYPVDREGGGRAAVRTAIELLKAGELVMLFPEGTRSPTGELLPGQLGAAFIASQARAPIVPVAVWGTDVLLPMHSRRLYRCPVHVKFGEPLYPPQPAEGERLSREQLQQVTDELMARIAQLQQQLRAEVPSKWLEREAQLKARWRAIHAAKNSC